MIELTDGSLIAQIGSTDMRLPIQYAFSYPERWDAPVPVLDLTQCAPLEFQEPAWDDFPCLRLAYQALEAERSLPIVLNAANEVAVSSFLAGRLSFPGIARIIERTMTAHVAAPTATLDAIRRVDRWARDYASTLIGSSEGRVGGPSAHPTVESIKGTAR
jgi:1-deoxy-D-xylulose-5-phosphate reductoisomerase